jgi:hypothetical protein
MVKDPAGPTIVGTHWHERVRLMPAVWLSIESIVTEADYPHRLSMDFHSHWFAGQLTYEIEPAGPASVLHQRETLRPGRPMLWLQRSIKPYLTRQVLRRLQDIKHILEQAGPLPGPGQ